MSVAVVVPFRPGCPHREAAWEWVRRRYAEEGWQVIEAPAPAGQWCKAAAVNPAVAECEAEIVVMADADVWTDGLPAAVEAVRDGAPWAIPHLLVHRLTEDATRAVLAGESWRRQSLEQPAYGGIPGGGIVVAPGETLRNVPLDLRFKSWGQEDESHGRALRTLAGERWRGDADLVHLWHPPQERMSRKRGSHESWQLRRRYIAAEKDPAAMAALIEESRRDAGPTAEPHRMARPAL